MSAAYKPVIWTASKLVYDAVLLVAVALYIFLFVHVAPRYDSVTLYTDDDMTKVQAFGTCAFLMFTFVLCIGPLARLDPRFLPLLYNRRHFGVLTAVIAATHAEYVLEDFFDYGHRSRWVALLIGNTSYEQVRGFPFELFGMFTLGVLIVMAVTSHDFWLRFLTPPVWKAIHMAAYLAYASIVLHVALGHLQSAVNPVFLVTFVAAVSSVTVLHVMAARRDVKAGQAPARAANEAPWVEAGRVDAIADSHGLVVQLDDGERVAIFRHDGRLSAISNVCAHQNGPLGEGRIIDGCVTCPWHGYQYRPADGCAPPPYTEKLATYRLKLQGDRILIDPRPNPPGTYVEPVAIGVP
jgi:nitrite reductase/ring-hydroxylating ferredoxin subunit/DMSO/TMAO reductase YedYZ heme-binding membrane subunit